MIALDPSQVDHVMHAIATKHRITPCEHCGGPEVHSKLRPEAKCFRCFAHRTTGIVASEAPMRKCVRCKQGFRSRVNWQYCEKCREKRAKQERARGKVEEAVLA